MEFVGPKKSRSAPQKIGLKVQNRASRKSREEIVECFKSGKGMAREIFLMKSKSS
jgi:hypothetical protein